MIAAYDREALHVIEAHIKKMHMTFFLYVFQSVGETMHISEQKGNESNLPWGKFLVLDTGTNLFLHLRMIKEVPLWRALKDGQVDRKLLVLLYVIHKPLRPDEIM